MTTKKHNGVSYILMKINVTVFETLVICRNIHIQIYAYIHIICMDIAQETDTSAAEHHCCIKFPHT